jgi:transcriptional regulator with XRE-family HTH domain
MFSAKDLFSFPIIDVEATSLKLKELREQRNITVTELKKIFSFEYPQAIYNWENPSDKTLPRLDNLVVLAKLYELSIDELIVIKHLQKDSISVKESSSPFGISNETLTFIRQNSSRKVLRALGTFFNCDLF